MTLLPTWIDGASCASTDPEAYYPSVGEHSYAAIRICEGCSVRTECLEDALAHEAGLTRTARFGIWGGTTPAQRVKIEQEGAA